MFCFQCEQTRAHSSCTFHGVCGKEEDTAQYQDRLTGELIALARFFAHRRAPASIDRLVLEVLFTTVTNVNFNDEDLAGVLATLQHEKQTCLHQFGTPDGDVVPYPMDRLWSAPDDIRSLKATLLFGMRGMAAYAYHALQLEYQNEAVMQFFYRGLLALEQDLSFEDVLKLLHELGKVNLLCMALLDEAHTKTFGTPEPTSVTCNIEAGPFIVVSGHDLHDLHLVLEQTKGTGVNVYTHGELLPAHGYPKLKQYPHLKGNFGTAWQNQQAEFAGLHAPILFTSNCLMPIQESYAARVFTTSVVSHPDAVHIDEHKDFTPLIEKALELGGYDCFQNQSGINGGDTLQTGYAHAAILAQSKQLLALIQSKKLRHIFLVGGCDGAASGRNEYTEFVKQTPPDTLVLTLACGKYRFNDLDLGQIEGLPRLMDLGQCNDAYSAIQILLALSHALHCSIDDLPVTLVLSWYEQKAVVILLTLLSLGIKNIYLGPTVPAFFSDTVMNHLSQTYGWRHTKDAAHDLAEILGAS